MKRHAISSTATTGDQRARPGPSSRQLVAGVGDAERDGEHRREEQASHGRHEAEPELELALPTA